MRLSLEFLQVLDAIDRKGSFAAAAEDLHRVPSAITYSVRQLEESLGIEVFDRRGTYITEAFISRATRSTGSVWDIALSRDPQQQFLYVADGHDQKLFILRRDTLEIVGSIGDGGRYPGTFYSVGSVAVDSKGNLYTGETLEGKRVQKFVINAAGR